MSDYPLPIALIAYDSAVLDAIMVPDNQILLPIINIGLPYHPDDMWTTTSTIFHDLNDPGQVGTPSPNHYFMPIGDDDYNHQSKGNFFSSLETKEEKKLSKETSSPSTSRIVG